MATKVRPPLNKPVLAVYPSAGSPDTYLNNSAGMLEANLTRFIAHAGRKPAIAMMYMLGYDPRGEFFFPADLCNICKSMDIVPMVLPIQNWAYEWLLPHHTLEAINAGMMDGIIHQRATESLASPGDLVMATGWEDPNIGDPAVIGDGWAHSHNAERIQLEAEQQGLIAGPGAPLGTVLLDGKVWPAGPAEYVKAERRWITKWREVRPDTTFHKHLCWSWGNLNTGRWWMHPKYWFPGKDYADWIGGGIGIMDQGRHPDTGAPTYAGFDQMLEPLVRELNEIEDAATLPFFLEMGTVRIDGAPGPLHPDCPQTAFWRRAWEVLRTKPAAYERLFRNGLTVEMWDDYASKFFWGVLEGQTVGQGIDYTPEILSAFKEGVTDPRLFTSVLEQYEDITLQAAPKKSRPPQRLPTPSWAGREKKNPFSIQG